MFQIILFFSFIYIGLSSNDGSHGDLLFFLGAYVALMLGLTILIYHSSIKRFLGLLYRKIINIIKNLFIRLCEYTSTFIQLLNKWLQIDNEGFKRMFIILLIVNGLLFGFIFEIINSGLFIFGIVFGFLITVISLKAYLWVREGFRGK